MIFRRPKIQSAFLLWIYAMLYVFVRDMWDVLRLRYRSPETYLYSPLVMAAVLLLLGVSYVVSWWWLFYGVD